MPEPEPMHRIYTFETKCVGHFVLHHKKHTRVSRDVEQRVPCYNYTNLSLFIGTHQPLGLGLRVSKEAQNESVTQLRMEISSCDCRCRCMPAGGILLRSDDVINNGVKHRLRMSHDSIIPMHWCNMRQTVETDLFNFIRGFINWVPDKRSIESFVCVCAIRINIWTKNVLKYVCISVESARYHEHACTSK